ncbi:MAG: bZIP transcription factor [Lachnospiraceae bacterium]|nr:bZIP transcription factor [Lachnospiraceae bacterium]
MNEYLKAQNKVNESIIKCSFPIDEIDRFSKSDYRWADNRSKNFQFRTVRKGEIYQFEFGKNFIPEMSYEHRGLVIGIKKKLLYVLPIFSYNVQKHTDVYHPVDFPNSTSDMFLLKSSEFSFISHDSVLKLNDLRTVSINRILYKQSGQISPSSDTYKQIETLVLKKYFPSFQYDFEQSLQSILALQENISNLEADKNNLTEENEKLKAEIESLKKKLVSMAEQ